MSSLPGWLERLMCRALSAAATGADAVVEIRAEELLRLIRTATAMADVMATTHVKLGDIRHSPSLGRFTHGKAAQLLATIAARDISEVLTKYREEEAK